jgi:hypothetical protein
MFVLPFVSGAGRALQDPEGVRRSVRDDSGDSGRGVGVQELVVDMRASRTQVVGANGARFLSVLGCQFGRPTSSVRNRHCVPSNTSIVPLCHVDSQLTVTAEDGQADCHRYRHHAPEGLVVVDRCDRHSLSVWL